MDMQSWMLVSAYVGSGLAMGLGAIGPAYGIGFAAAKACEGVARQPHAAGSITKTMLVGQAVSESPAIFALLISIFLTFKIFKMPETVDVMHITTTIAAGLCVGLGALGPGAGSGMANAEACAGVARDPKLDALLLRTMLVGQAVAQSTSVYALVISMCLLFVV